MGTERTGRSDTARIGGLSVVAKYGPDVIAGRARRGLAERFRRQALEADSSLADHPEQLEARAALFRRIHMCKMALASKRARAARNSTEKGKKT